MAFIPGIELSPSWGHFNAYPLKVGARLAIDTSTASIERGAAGSAPRRRHGRAGQSSVHPLRLLHQRGRRRCARWFRSAPSTWWRSIRRCRGMMRKYSRGYGTSGMKGGTITSPPAATRTTCGTSSPAAIRTFVHLAGPVTAEAFAAALKAGHAYVSYGPIIYPATMFGSEIRAMPGQTAVLAFELGSVAGLRKVELIGDGQVRETRTFESAPVTTHVDFTSAPGAAALVCAGRRGSSSAAGVHRSDLGERNRRGDSPAMSDATAVEVAAGIPATVHCWPHRSARSCCCLPATRPATTAAPTCRWPRRCWRGARPARHESRRGAGATSARSPPSACSPMRSASSFSPDSATTGVGGATS